jgi:hypothetical protein
VQCREGLATGAFFTASFKPEKAFRKFARKYIVGNGESRKDFLPGRSVVVRWQRYESGNVVTRQNCEKQLR